MIPDKQIKEIRQDLMESARPLIFFDDDPDGLCSFIQFYKLNPEGTGVIYKRSSALDSSFLRKVEEIQPDKVFILDIPKVDQSFPDKVKNISWIDHHSVADIKGLKYYNPMIASKGKNNWPISYWSHLITDVSPWIACVGCVSDWFLPPKKLREELKKDYPDLLPDSIKTPEEALFTTEIGKLARAFSFILKGKNTMAMTFAKILTRIKDPYEILDQSTSQGKKVWKAFQKINKKYEELKNSIEVTDSPLIQFIYEDSQISLTSDLSNETLYHNPDKFILIARYKAGEYKISMRSAKYKVREILPKALEGVEGYGGGHLYACGGMVKKDSFDKFIKQLLEQL
jgi:hypothetical protein